MNRRDLLKGLGGLIVAPPILENLVTAAPCSVGTTPPPPPIPVLYQRFNAWLGGNVHAMDKLYSNGYTFFVHSIKDGWGELELISDARPGKAVPAPTEPFGEFHVMKNLFQIQDAERAANDATRALRNTQTYRR